MTPISFRRHYFTIDDYFLFASYSLRDLAFADYSHFHYSLLAGE